MAALAVSGFGLSEYPWVSMARGMPVASADSPNILLLVLDTVRAQNLSLYGYARLTTPNLERIAKRGVRFDRAMASTSWTLPSHASMFTGRWPHELSVDFLEPLDTTYPTLAEVLRDHGYATAGFVANLDFCSRPYGLARGYSHYEDFPVSVGEAILSCELGRFVSNKSSVRRLVGYPDVLNRKNAAQITNDFLSWQQHQKTTPFFAYLNYYDAHQPYLPPSPYDTAFGPGMNGREPLAYYTNDAIVERMWALSADEIGRELAAYDGAIAYLDHQIGVLVEELSARGVLDNTLVIITSDHGEQFGEHGLFSHANSLYTQTLHVPLVLFGGKNVPPGAVVSKPVSLRNLPATILDLAGLQPQNLIPGASLSSTWLHPNEPDLGSVSPILSELTAGKFGVQDWYPNANGNVTAVVKDRYHYIRNSDGTEEIYDLVQDPLEDVNLVTTAASGQLLGQLRAHLDDILHL